MPREIRGSKPLQLPCPGCEALWVCGGRCLFANRTMFWGREWFDGICETTKHMIAELGKLVPETRELIEEGVIEKNAFDYPVINNGCEIIP